MDLATSLGTRTIWLEATPAADDLAAAQATVAAAGMTLATGSIAEAARSIRP